MPRPEVDKSVMELAKLKFLGGMTLGDVVKEPGVAGKVSLSKLKKACADGGWSEERERRGAAIMNGGGGKGTEVQMGGAQTTIHEMILREEVRQARQMKLQVERMMDVAMDGVAVQIPAAHGLMNQLLSRLREKGDGVSAGEVMETLKASLFAMDNLRKVMEGLAKYDPRLSDAAGEEEDASKAKAREEAARERQKNMNFGEYV